MNEVPVGIDWPEQGERFARLREAITLIKELWAEDFVDFDGQFFKTHEATVYDRPDEPRPDLHRRLRARPPPASPGGSATASSAPAARARSCTRRRSCRASPRAPRRPAATCRAMDRMIEMKVSFDTDYARAKEDTKVWAALALPGDKKLGVHDPREMEVLAKEAEPYAHTRWLVSSDPDEHVEQIAPYIGWGFNHLVFHFPGEAQLEAIDRYAEPDPAEAARPLRLTGG